MGDDDSLLLPRGCVRRSSAAFPICYKGNILRESFLSGGGFGLAGCLDYVVRGSCLAGWHPVRGALGFMCVGNI